MHKITSSNKLRKIILEKNIPLDLIDTSEITDMSFLFKDIEKINGSISNWNTSNVRNMAGMFFNSALNQDISSWNISSVTNMENMFCESTFSQNLGAWDLENKRIEGIFFYSSYSLEDYELDRTNFLINQQLEKNIIIKENNKKYLLEEQNKINNELSKDINLDTIELEF